MKKRSATIILFLLVCLMALFIALKLDAPVLPTAANQGGSSATAAKELPALNPDEQPPPQPAIAHLKALAHRVLDLDRRDHLADWKTPISFFGLVVDETGQPVPHADVEFLCNDLSREGTTSYKRTSGSDGRFSIDGISGKYLAVRIAKQGFYTSKSNPFGFFYAGENTNFVADAANPITFRLKRMGTIAKLVNRHGVVKVPQDGTSVVIPMLPPQTEVKGSWQILATSAIGKKDPQTARYDWKLLLSMPAGGIQTAASEFNFEAPSVGYQQNLTITSEPPTAKNWQPTFTGEFFVMESGKFARISIRFMAGNGALRFESFTNPDGSRNLESAFERQ